MKLMSDWFTLHVAIGFTGSTRAAERRASLEAGAVQLIERDSFLVVERDDEAEQLDAAAGCEFVDDRIRGRE